MFRCGSCKNVSKPCEKAFKRVVATRNVTYLSGRVGTEIVKELTVCAGENTRLVTRSMS